MYFILLKTESKRLWRSHLPILIVILLIALLALLLPVNASATGAQNAGLFADSGQRLGDDGGVILALSPPTVTTTVTETFELIIEVQAGAQEVDGAAAHLNFDPTYLEVLNMAPSNTLPSLILNQFDNDNGRVDFAAGTFNNFPTGTFTLATVTFRTKSVTEETAINFNTTLPRTSDVTFGGTSILNHITTGTTIEVVENLLWGDANGDGVLDAADISAVVLEIFDGDGNNPIDTPGGTFPGTPNSDANQDESVDAADISCVVLIIFEGAGACQNP